MLRDQVLFIPGICGNEIRWRGRFFRSQEGVVWVNTTRLAISGMQWLMLDPGGSGPASSWYPFTFAGDSVAYYYPPLLDYLRGRDAIVQDMRTDWRMRLEADALACANVIREMATVAPVNVLCHSRGGLLAAAALAILSAAGELAKVRQGISLGTPWRGSYAPVAYLGGWAPAVATLHILGRLASLNATALVAGRSVREIVASWPGIYELLPDPVSAVANGQGEIESLYNAFLWGQGGRPVSDFHLSHARDRWRTPPTLPAAVKWTHIVGTGFATLGPYFPAAVTGSGDSIGLKLDGDGTVPTWSAEALGGRILRVPVSHSAMPSSSIVHGMIEGLLQEA